MSNWNQKWKAINIFCLPYFICMVLCHSEGDQPWDFFGRNDAKAEAPVLWPPHVKSWLIGKDSDAGRDWGQEEKAKTEDEMAGWHHRLGGRESQWTPGDGDGEGGLACCDSRGRRVRHDWVSELNWYYFHSWRLYKCGSWAVSGTYMTTSFTLVHQLYFLTRPDTSEPLDL